MHIIKNSFLQTAPDTKPSNNKINTHSQSTNMPRTKSTTGNNSNVCIIFGRDRGRFILCFQEAEELGGSLTLGAVLGGQLLRHDHLLPALRLRQRPLLLRRLVEHRQLVLQLLFVRRLLLLQLLLQANQRTDQLLNQVTIQ